jgi:two-component system, LytTR family, response regulator
VRVLIVDDERLARYRLRCALAAHPSIQVVGEAASVSGALTAIAEYKPDVVFLDINMPDGSGFRVVEASTVPFVTVFVTAYDEYAVRAFEVQALDYLLKPVAPDRLQGTLERLATRSSADTPVFAHRIFLRTHDGGRFISFARIVAIGAAGSYTDVHVEDGSTHLVHRTMEEWESQLPAAIFRRVHRSSIVNLDQVVRMEPLLAGGYRLIMRAGPPVTVSRRRGTLLRRTAP